MRFKKIWCKLSHRKYFEEVIWNDGISNVKRIRCNKCEKYPNNFCGGSCEKCGCGLINAYIVELCSGCRKNKK